MNPKHFVPLALGAALLLALASSARADDKKGDSSGGRSADARQGGGKASSNIVYRGSSGAYTGGGSTGRGSTGRTYRSSGGGYSPRASYSAGGGGRGNYKYAFSSRQGWSPGNEYFWHGHHYRWYNDGWFIIDPFPYYVADPYYYGGSYDDGPAYGPAPAAPDANSDAPVAVQVQRELARAGYYHGDVDGIIGPETRAAIAAYQRDNGLRPTGTINGHLLDALDISPPQGADN